MNKQIVYNFLFQNSLKKIYNVLITNKYNISKLLSIVAHERYLIEFILNALYPELQLNINLDKFGRCRSSNDSHGRKYRNNNFNKELYKPFKFLLDLSSKNYEVLYTPIYKKYKHYNTIIRKKCIENNSYLTQEPLLHLLYKYNHRVYTIFYENIELTTFYYELDDNLYKELDSIPIEDRRLSNNINLYRAIYHTDPFFHETILEKVNNELKFILDEKNEKNRILNIMNIYWWLSQATLYERGSCSITELLCNVLLLYVLKYSKQLYIFKQKKDINLDIEAMLINNPKDFNKEYINKIYYENIKDIHIYYNINIDNFKNIIINKKFYKLTHINSIYDILNNISEPHSINMLANDLYI